MSQRQHLISDLGDHLADEIHTLTIRHMLLMRAAGMTPDEGVAAALHALEGTSFTILGMAVANTDPAKRADEAEALIIEQAATLRAQIPKMIERLGTLDKRWASR